MCECEKRNREDIVNMPVLRYLKEPVMYVSELYARYPGGGEYGWYALVLSAGLFYYWDSEEKKWRAVGGKGGETLAEQYYAGVSDLSTYLGIPIDIASGVNQKSSFPSGTTITVVNDNVNFYVTGTYTATTRVTFTDGSFREDTFNVVVNPSVVTKYTWDVLSENENKGTVSSTPAPGLIGAGTPIVVTALANTPLYAFDKWVDEDMSVVSVTNVFSTVMPNKDYSLTAIFKDATPEPDDPTMYYGNTPTAPQIFQSMSINEIFALPGLTPKSIPLGETNFIIHQENSLHYLLIPENDMYLKQAEYGTVLITTLWSSATQSGAYFTTNPGGTYQGIPYRVFFSYSPMGAFPDDIRIKIIN